MSKQKKISRRVLTSPKTPAPIIGGVVTPRPGNLGKIAKAHERAASDRARGIASLKKEIKKEVSNDN